MKRQSVLVLAVLAVVLVGNRASADLYYDVIDLGTIGGRSSTALSINNNGQIVGSSFTSSGEEHATLLNYIYFI